MCSIFGFVARKNQSPRLDVLRSITRGNIARGPHAFGFAWIDGFGRLRMYKQTGRLTDSLGVLAMARNARLLVGHLRFATHGDCENNINNHPHPADGGWIVHNGIVHNHAQLTRQLKLGRVTDCDSEVLGLMLELSDGSLSNRCAATARLTEGNLAMLGLWSRPSRMIAVRRGNPLHLAESEEGVYLATLVDGLPGRPKPLADGQVVEFTMRGGAVKSKRTTLPRSRWESAADCHQPLLYRGG